MFTGPLNGIFIAIISSLAQPGSMSILCLTNASSINDCAGTIGSRTFERWFSKCRSKAGDAWCFNFLLARDGIRQACCCRKGKMGVASFSFVASTCLLHFGADATARFCFYVSGWWLLFLLWLTRVHIWLNFLSFRTACFSGSLNIASYAQLVKEQWVHVEGCFTHSTHSIQKCMTLASNAHAHGRMSCWKIGSAPTT